MISRCLLPVLALCTLVLGAQPATAAEPVDAAQILQQGAAAPALAEEGRKASFFCANCHGESGNSKHGEVPNLAGQHPAYVLKQIDAFLTGKRKDEFMQGLMKVLSERDKAAISLYYAGAAVKPALAKAPASAARGGELYAKHCARCHQADARGAETFPRLAGQQPEYLRLSLKRYLTQSGERFYAPMTAAVMQLGEQNIDAVVGYLAAKE